MKYITVELLDSVVTAGILPTAPATVTVGTAIVTGSVFLVSQGPNPVLPSHTHPVPGGETGLPNPPP